MWKRLFSGLSTFTILVQGVGAFPISVNAITTTQEDSFESERLATAFNYNGHSYYTFSGKASSWEEAREYCESVGGYLAVINGEDENDYLFSLLQQQGFDCAYFGLYLDDSDPMECRWKWVHGNSSYFHWDEGEPNNNGFNERNGMFFGSSMWNDGCFGAVSEFICEWDYEDAVIYNMSCEIGNRIVFNGHHYAVFNNVVDTWEQARIYCEEQGGYLAVINDADENAALFNMIRSLGYENAYFGYTDRDSEGNWKWVDNDTSTYVNWGKHEPNGDEYENYAMFYESYPNGEWNDGDFGEKGVTVYSGKTFICEWDSVENEAPVYEDKSFDLHYTGNLTGEQETVHLSADYEIGLLASAYTSFIYHPDMAYLLSIIASSAYTESDIEYNLNSLGFDKSYRFNYYPTATDSRYEEDSCAVTISTKQSVTNDQIVLIAIRGSVGGIGTIFEDNSDWHSNVNIQAIGDDIIHFGFSEATRKIYEQVELYFGGVLPKDHVKYVITGHSRGAGVGNLLAKEICDSGVAYTDVFAYNFACPDSIMEKESKLNPDGIYDNIFNIGVAGDPVTVIPGVLGDKLFERYKFDQADLEAEKGAWWSWLGFTKAEPRYWGKYGQSRWASLKWSAENTQTEFKRHASEYYVSVMAHEMEFSKLKTWRQMQFAEIFTMDVFCPVDAEIFDSQGNLIAAVYGDEVVNEYADENISVFVCEEDGHKHFIVFGTSDVKVKLTGTEDGTMDCVISAVSNAQYRTEFISCYSDVELLEGKTMEAIVSTNTNAQAKELCVYNGEEVAETITPSAFIPSKIYGDLNSDDQLVIADAVLLLRLMAEDTSLDVTNLDLEMADLNCDGCVDILDSARLLRFLQQAVS